MAATYVHRVYPFMLMESINTCLGAFSMGQRVVHYGVIVIAIGAIYHVTASYIF